MRWGLSLRAVHNGKKLRFLRTALWSGLARLTWGVAEGQGGQICQPVATLLMPLLVPCLHTLPQPHVPSAVRQKEQLQPSALNRSAYASHESAAARGAPLSTSEWTGCSAHGGPSCVNTYVPCNAGHCTSWQTEAGSMVYRTHHPGVLRVRRANGVAALAGRAPREGLEATTHGYLHCTIADPISSKLQTSKRSWTFDRKRGGGGEGDSLPLFFPDPQAPTPPPPHPKR